MPKGVYPHIPRNTKEERFFKHVQVQDSCWIWTGCRFKKGYGRFAFTKHHIVQAHRFSWTLVNSPIPSHLQVDHLCRDRACVNPLHMELVTSRENSYRGNNIGALYAQRTHCKNGHRFDESNTKVIMLSETCRWRVCRQCRRINNKRYEQRIANDSTNA